MKCAILDTHTLVWFLKKDPQLSAKALKLILNEEVLKVIPLIVLCEIHYLHQQGRFSLPVQEAVDRIHEVDSFEIFPHGEDLIPHLLPPLDIHDALIVATGLLKQQKDNIEACIISRDQKIKKESPLTVVWE